MYVITLAPHEGSLALRPPCSLTFLSLTLLLGVSDLDDCTPVLTWSICFDQLYKFAINLLSSFFVLPFYPYFYDFVFGLLFLLFDFLNLFDPNLLANLLCGALGCAKRLLWV